MIYVILPAFNEEEALPALLDTFISQRGSTLPADIIVTVVDDGSSDSTAEVVQGFSAREGWIRLLRHEVNQGLAQGIRSGFADALAQAGLDDVVITLDADNTQPPEYIAPMLAAIKDGADIVVASRFRPGAQVHGVPALRRFYSQVMSVLFQVILPIKGIRDYSCGFRAYRASILRRADEAFGPAFITEKGFACMVEILIKLNMLHPVTFTEVPFILYYDRKPTPTKMKVVRTIRDTLRLAAQHRLGRTAQP